MGIDVLANGKSNWDILSGVQSGNPDVVELDVLHLIPSNPTHDVTSCRNFHMGPYRDTDINIHYSSVYAVFLLGTWINKT